MIRSVELSDAQKIAEIYNHYIESSIATFETQPISKQEMAQRIKDTQENNLPYLVTVDGQNQVLGYAYASKWKGRCAYRFSVESTVYLAAESTGQGLGKALYDALFKELKQMKYHAVIAGISLPNHASVSMHETFGMKKVAHFEQVGFKFDQWVDVGYWQKLL